MKPFAYDAGVPYSPQTWNRYAYVGNEPLSAVDSSGLDAIHCLAAARRMAIKGCGGGGGNPFDSFTLDGAPVDGGLTLDLFDAGDGPGGPGGFGAVSGSVYSCATFACGPTVVGQNGDPELVGTPGEPQCIEPSRDGTYCYQWQVPTLDSLLEPLPEMDFLEFGSSVEGSQQFSTGGGGSSAAGSGAWAGLKGDASTFGHWLVADRCGTAPGDAILRTMRLGSIRGAVFGAWWGGFGGGAAAVGVGAIPGAIFGGAVGGIGGAAGGAFWGSAIAGLCSAVGEYGN